MEIGKVDSIVGMPAVLAEIPAVSPEQRAEQQRMVKAVQTVNDAKLFGQSSELTFTFDRNSRKMILKIVDRETQEVIRQIPPELLLRLADEADKG